MATIKLQSSDNEIFEVDIRAAKCSKTIRCMLEDCQMDDNQQIVPLLNVKSRTLRKVLEWVEYHKNDPQPCHRSYSDIDVPPWDKAFLDVDRDTLYDIMMAANYMDISGLLDFTCTTVANIIKGRSTQEIRDIFGLKNDFTPAEEEQLRIENAGLEYQ